MPGAGLDVGTSFLIVAREAGESVEYKEFRDAFYRIKPSTPIAAKVMERGLQSLSHFKDTDGSFVIVGQDAIEKAVERHDSARRPLYRGVLSPKEPDARRVLKFILSQVLGAPAQQGDTVVYSVPAQPLDQLGDDFDTGYHEDVLKKDLSELGWTPHPLNEAEAICYSELENDEYTGVAFSFGAGCVNFCLMSNGEAILKACTTRSGDWIDRMAAQSTAQPDSIIQVEKENGEFIVGEESANPILSAVSAYYIRLIDYTIQHFNARLQQSDLPKFSTTLPIIVSGGTSRAKGFVDTFRNRLQSSGCSLPLKEVRPAQDQLRAVARGCLLANSFMG